MYVDGRIEILSDFFFRRTHTKEANEREREGENKISSLLFHSLLEHACSVLSLSLVLLMSSTMRCMYISQMQQTVKRRTDC